MSTFHINPNSGDVGPCRATKANCPFGGRSGKDNHYDSIMEAAAAYEAVMEGETFSKDVHWNPRTNSPANCPTRGCAAGVALSEHFPDWRSATEAQEPRWTELLRNGALKGRELTAVARYSWDKGLLDHVLEKGSPRHVVEVLARVKHRLAFEENQGEEGEPTVEDVSYYHRAVERNLHLTHSADFVGATPTNRCSSWTFWGKHGILSEDERVGLVLAEPHGLMAQRSPSPMEDGHFYLSLIRAAMKNGEASPEQLEDIEKQLRRSSSVGRFHSGTATQAMNKLHADVKATRELVQAELRKLTSP